MNSRHESLLKDDNRVATAQQIHTLLYHLTTKQPPPFAVLFWSNLQKIEFDYSAQSIAGLSRFFAALSQHNCQLADVLAKKGGQALVLTVAAYIADYLATATGQTIEWYDYTAMCEEVARQNARHHTYLQLPASFENSLTARIGQKVYCQPLKLLPSLLNGEEVLSPFIAEMTQTIHQQTQVNLLQAPDDVCRDYLAKLKTGKLLDPSIGFFSYLADVNFDYSLASLGQIDKALAAIAQDFSFQRDDYVAFVQQSSQQAFCYLLGFYIGVTSSRLANAAVRWVSYEQMYESLGEEFGEAVEHSFVLLLEDGYRTPMLVVTNRLFALAKKFPTTATAFAQIVIAQNAGHISVLPMQSNANHGSAAMNLPSLWQQAMQAAGTVVGFMLSTLAQGQRVLPCIYQATTQGTIPLTKQIEFGDESTAINLAEIQPLPDAATDIDTVIDSLYQTLHHNPKLSPFGVACFDSYVNLPMGRTEGIVIEVRVYDSPTLQLQLMLPYQSANDSHSLTIYPLVSNQAPAQGATDATITGEQLTTLTSYFYQACLNYPIDNLFNKSVENPFDKPAIAVNSVWQQAYVNELDVWALSPKDKLIAQQKTQLLSHFDFPVLPMAEMAAHADSPSVSYLADFDYASLHWRGFDLYKQILQRSVDEQSYLQVFASDSLIKHELYRQAQATEGLYRYGKVVWGVVVACDDELTKPMDEDERDKPFANHPICSADILFDPTGQASVDALQAKASQLRQAVAVLSQQPKDTVAMDVDFYHLHLQDSNSSVFNLPYPASVASVDYRISSSWIWRRHLPNGMLSSKVVPIIITNDNHSDRHGEIMVLPSKLWD